MTMRKIAFLLASAFLLAGCWQSESGSLYAGVSPLRPFQPGRVTERDETGVQHFRLTLDASGTYFLIGDDKGKDGYGEGISLRFFPLAGAAKDALIYEAVSLDDCVPGTKTCGQDDKGAPRIYGLVLPRSGGADEIRPDCIEDGAIMKSLGIAMDENDSCDFRDRATLEKALARLAKTGKAAHFYSLD